MATNFSFVIDGALAGCAHPGMGSMLAQHLSHLRGQHGITAVVSLSEHPLNADAVAEAGLRYFHLPTPDFSVPAADLLQQGVVFALSELGGGGCVVAHCMAGIGRTGLFLACCLVGLGYAPAEAIALVRKKRPGSIETSEQEAFIHEEAAALKKACAGIKNLPRRADRE